MCGSRLTASNWGGVPHSGFVKETLYKIRNMFQGKYKGENGKKRSNGTFPTPTSQLWPSSLPKALWIL